MPRNKEKKPKKTRGGKKVRKATKKQRQQRSASQPSRRVRKTNRPYFSFLEPSVSLEIQEDESIMPEAQATAGLGGTV
jgi:hypothetical protein